MRFQLQKVSLVRIEVFASDLAPCHSWLGDAAVKADIWLGSRSQVGDDLRSDDGFGIENVSDPSMVICRITCSKNRGKESFPVVVNDRRHEEKPASGFRRSVPLVLRRVGDVCIGTSGVVGTYDHPGELAFCRLCAD